jgi:hypothetical protein
MFGRSIYTCRRPMATAFLKTVVQLCTTGLGPTLRGLLSCIAGIDRHF